MTGDLDHDKYLEISEKSLKNLYEKFCYLNHLTEKRLSDDAVKDILEKKYGYKFVPDGS